MTATSFVLLLLSIVQCKDIVPSISNSSGDYYINSQSTSTTFQFDSITCKANNCIIICDAISGCYGMNINAELSQTLTVKCDNINSCYQSDIITSSISTTIQCNNINSCFQTNITVNITSNIDIYCNIKQSITESSDSPCYTTNIYANHADTVNIYAETHYSAYKLNVYGSNINKWLNINCEYDSSCLESIIYCPVNSDCNINCLQQYSCSNVDIFIPNHQYEGLNFDCNDTVNNSCFQSNINCINSDGVTNWNYWAINNQWNCGNYECCPFNHDIIACNSGEDCVLNCTSTICINKQIDASLSTSLELYCDSFASCQGSNIVCPIGDDTSCDIICNGVSSCSYCIIQAKATIQDTVSLECSETNSCEWSSIFVLSSSLIKELSVSCTDSNACSNMNILFNEDTTTIINILSVSCINNESCSSLSINGFNTQVDSFNINCIGSEIHTCKSINVSTTITDTININCAAISSCQKANFAFILKNTATSNVVCSNVYITHDSTLGACYDALFTGNNFNNEDVNDIFVTCNQNDCIQTVFEFYNVDNIQITCNSPYSCHKAIINVSQSNTLTIDCGEANACSSTAIYCPHSSINSCLINCNEYDYVCKDMDIYTPNEYTYNYLNLTCSSSPYNNNNNNSNILNYEPCNKIEFNCFGVTYPKASVEYIYDTEQQEYVCEYQYLYRCCPFLSGGTIIPCNSNQDCFIDCKSGDCTNAYINGSNANTLIINCTSENACANSIISCPNGDCTINCDVDYTACDNTKIYHYGSKADQATVSLNCYRYGACEMIYLYASNATTINVDAKTYVPRIFIYGQNAENINIECGNGKWRQKPNRQSGGQGCVGANIYADNADNIHIKCSNYFGCDSLDLYANNANFIHIEATQIKSWDSGRLFASNANTVEIYCSQSRYTDCGACAPGTACNGEWYVPSNTVFNCYGYGCNGIGTVSVMNKSIADNIEINVNGCGECCDIEECMGGFVFQCNPMCDCVVSTCENTLCECEELLSKIRSFSNDEDDKNCAQSNDWYNPECSSRFGWGFLSTGEWIGIIIGIIIICCCIVCIVFRCRRRLYLKRHLNMQQTDRVEMGGNHKMSKQHQLVGSTDDLPPSYDTVR